MFPTDSIMTALFLPVKEVCSLHRYSVHFYRVTAAGTVTAVFPWISTDSAPRGSAPRVRTYSFKQYLPKPRLKTKCDNLPHSAKCYINSHTATCM